MCWPDSVVSNQNMMIFINSLLYKTFIDAEDNLVYLKDSDLKYVFVNKAFTYFFELNEDEVADLTTMILWMPRLRKKTGKPIERFSNTER